MGVEDSLRFPGLRMVCIREVQKDLKHSAKQLIEDKARQLGVGGMFDPRVAEVCTPGGGVILFQGMQDHTADSIKSLEGMDRAWIEEAQTLSANSWRMLRPTIRKEGSEIWASWNPRLRTDPIDQFFRQGAPDAGVVSVQANWRDNPWFPAVMEEDRQRDLRSDPEAYPHVWEGDYVTILQGAYYAAALRDAERQERIGNVAHEPLMQIRAFWDIGGPGKKADAMAIWIGQFVGREIRVLDYIEGQGQVLAYYLHELRERGWKDEKKPLQVLPHDAAQTHADNPTGMDFEAQLRKAGFDTQIIANQGPGAVMQRIATARRLFPRIWFNKRTTEAGRAALGWYHEKRDEERNVGLGPEHDWASHGADAFGLMCIAYEEPQVTLAPKKPVKRSATSVV